MQGLTLLVADDDSHVRDLVQLYFGREGARVMAAADGTEALQMLQQHSFDLVILDVMMPGVDGFGVCREVRKSSEVPVLMLTARGEEIDRVLGLELGADDYVVKPFSPRELVARARAVLRRTLGRKVNGDGQGVSPLTYPGLEVDLQAREVRVDGTPLTLAPKEFDLLACLAQHPRIVLEREQLLERVWGYTFTGDTRTVDTHIKRLRLKLGEPFRNYIQTVWGIGYKFEVSAHAGD